jgi:hypothetical protein
METSETTRIPEDRMILFLPVELGIVITCNTLLVKMESLHQKCKGDLLGFFKETGCCWDMNGTLCSAAAMTLGDLDECFEALGRRGMQCESAPVDFYVVSQVASPSGWESCCDTLDDGELEYYHDEDHRPCARLKTAPVRERRSL